MLTVDSVSVRYGETCIVQDASFVVQSGQWLMLCGPNGAGKSTLVNAIAQGVRYTGNILLNGQIVKNIKPMAFARQVGVLAQNNTVGFAFTVEEVVQLGRYAHAKGMLARDDKDGAAQVDAAMEATGLLALRDHSMLTLSGGEMQRAFLAQVFAQAPSLLILDEPANHLDLVYQRQLFSLIEKWLKTPGRAVISVVHDLSLARKYGTHAMLMHEGRAVALGETRDVLNRDNLRRVYGMDVYEWMRDMLKNWRDEE